MSEPKFLIDAICTMVSEHLDAKAWAALSLERQVCIVLQMHVLLIQEDLDLVKEKLKQGVK